MKQWYVLYVLLYFRKFVQYAFAAALENISHFSIQISYKVVIKFAQKIMK